MMNKELHYGSIKNSSNKDGTVSQKQSLKQASAQ